MQGREEEKKGREGAGLRLLSCSAQLGIPSPRSCSVSAQEASSQSCVSPGLLCVRIPFHGDTVSPQGCMVPGAPSPRVPSHPSRKGQQYHNATEESGYRMGKKIYFFPMYLTEGCFLDEIKNSRTKKGTKPTQSIPGL